MGNANLNYLIDRRAKVRKAIDEVLDAGQSMSLDDGISYTRVNLRWLRSYEKELDAQITRLKGGRPTFQPVKMKGFY